ncbi:hypothetical protein B0H13DRAFT_179599 [Mycena leptocephala]|nr:hypothetical protein B0H13DRAFT_179599 [Mycena leptocephala]
MPSRTRREALEILYGWASEPSSATGSILWLHGPAGVGKSAILRTLTQRLHAAGRLGASFVFRRQHSPQKNADALFCIIAYQLAINIPHLRTSISRVVRKNPGIVGETMAIQLQELILQPCREVVLLSPLILVVDGLDEFAHNAQRDILFLLASAVQSRLPLRILVGSRREQYIAEILAEPSLSGLWRSFNVERSFEDVRSYLWVELTRIQDCSFDSAPWLSTQVLDAFVAASSGCFLYASTLIKFLGDADFSPTKRLAAVERFSLSHINYSADELYTQILTTVSTCSRHLYSQFSTSLLQQPLPIYHFFISNNSSI